MEGDGAEGTEPVDVAKVDSAGEEEEGTEPGGAAWLARIPQTQGEGEGEEEMTYKRKKISGPARSESSIKCWSMRLKGLSTASVWRPVSPRNEPSRFQDDVPCSVHGRGSLPAPPTGAVPHRSPLN